MNNFKYFLIYLSIIIFCISCNKRNSPINAANKYCECLEDNNYLSSPISVKKYCNSFMIVNFKEIRYNEVERDYIVNKDETYDREMMDFYFDYIKYIEDNCEIRKQELLENIKIDEGWK